MHASGSVHPDDSASFMSCHVSGLPDMLGNQAVRAYTAIATGSLRCLTMSAASVKQLVKAFPSMRDSFRQACLQQSAALIEAQRNIIEREREAAAAAPAAAAGNNNDNSSSHSHNLVHTPYIGSPLISPQLAAAVSSPLTLSLHSNNTHSPPHNSTHTIPPLLVPSHIRSRSNSNSSSIAGGDEKYDTAPVAAAVAGEALLSSSSPSQRRGSVHLPPMTAAAPTSATTTATDSRRTLGISSPSLAPPPNPFQTLTLSPNQPKARRKSASQGRDGMIPDGMPNISNINAVDFPMLGHSQSQTQQQQQQHHRRNVSVPRSLWSRRSRSSSYILQNPHSPSTGSSDFNSNWAPRGSPHAAVNEDSFGAAWGETVET